MSDVYYDSGSGDPIIDVYWYCVTGHKCMVYSFHMDKRTKSWRVTVSYDLYYVNEKGI